MLLDIVSHLVGHLQGLTVADIIEHIGNLLIPGIIERFFFAGFLQDRLQPFCHFHKGLYAIGVRQVFLALQKRLRLLTEGRHPNGHAGYQE